MTAWHELGDRQLSSHWEYIHDRFLLIDIARNQDLMEAIAREQVILKDRKERTAATKRQRRTKHET